MLVKDGILLISSGKVMGLGKFHENSNYKSGWKPLAKEGDLNVVGSVTESGNSIEKGKKQADPTGAEFQAVAEIGKKPAASCSCAVKPETEDGGAGKRPTLTAAELLAVAEIGKKPAASCSCTVKPETEGGGAGKRPTLTAAELFAVAEIGKKPAASCSCAVKLETEDGDAGKRLIPAATESPAAAEIEKKPTASCSCAVKPGTENGDSGKRLAPAAAESPAAAGNEAVSAAGAGMSEQSELLTILSRIGADIDALNHRILRQSEKIDTLLQLMEKATEKKNIFRSGKK